MGLRYFLPGLLCSFAVCAQGVDSGVSEQTTAGLSIETIAERRIVSGEAIQYVPAVGLRVGDEIFYTLRVRNTLGNVIREPIITRPIPRNTRYVANSAVGPGVQVDLSFDGGKTYVGAEQVEAQADEGSPRRSLKDCSAIRWRLRHPLPAGATAILRFRAVFQ